MDIKPFNPPRNFVVDGENWKTGFVSFTANGSDAKYAALERVGPQPVQLVLRPDERDGVVEDVKVFAKIGTGKVQELEQPLYTLPSAVCAHMASALETVAQAVGKSVSPELLDALAKGADWKKEKEVDPQYRNAVSHGDADRELLEIRRQEWQADLDDALENKDFDAARELGGKLAETKEASAMYAKPKDHFQRKHFAEREQAEKLAEYNTRPWSEGRQQPGGSQASKVISSREKGSNDITPGL